MTKRADPEAAPASDLKDDVPAEEPPEQHRGGEEENPVGLPPKAGYPSLDPRHAQHPFRPEKR